MICLRRLYGFVVVLALLGAAFVVAPSLPAAHAAAAAPALLNPNTATEAQLRALPQLDAMRVARILRERPYATIGQFNKSVAAGMDAEQVKLLYGRLFIPINLNTAPREDIMLIPMPPRMVREFLEYRPYANIEQFNREIGKYVDEAEVARLRSYVTLN